MISARVLVLSLCAPLLLFAATSCSDEEEPVPGLPLCSACTTNADCDSGTCKSYGMGQLKCSNPCTTDTAATACASPALAGCNGMGYCICP